MKKILLTATFCILLATSCEKEHKMHNDNRFDIKCESSYFRNDTLDMPVSGGSASIGVLTSETAVAWGIRTALDKFWCDVVKYADSFTVSVPANEEGFRESTVTVVVGENSRVIRVLQDYRRILACDVDTVDAVRSGGDCSVPFTTNIDASLITVSCPGTWLNSFVVSAGKISFKADENTGGSDRSTEITVEAEGLSFKVVVIQPAKEKEPDANILPEVIVNPVVNL